MTDRRQTGDRRDEPRTPDRRQHGTRRRYRQGCSCRPCRLANAAAVASWRQTGGADPWLDAGLVQARLIAWDGQGIGTREIAKHSGLSRSVLQAIRAGARTRIRQSDALVVLGLELQPALGTLVGAWQTKRWIRALLSEGYTDDRLAALQGLKAPQLTPHTDRVRRSTEARYRWLYRQLTAEGPNELNQAK